MNGEPAWKVQNGINPHPMAKVSTKNVIIGCRFTNDIRHPLS